MQSYLSLFCSLLLLLNLGFAQSDGPTTLPKGGYGIAVGPIFGSLADNDFNGVTVHGRFVLLPTVTYPITFLTLDAEYTRMRFSDDIQYGNSSSNLTLADLNANRFAIGPAVGIMIPLDLFFDVKNAPRGVGPPIYFGYYPIDQIRFEDFDEVLSGQSIKLGLQLPLPISRRIGTNLQFEYRKSFFDESDEKPVFLQEIDDINASVWSVVFQVGLTFGSQ